MTEVTVKVSKFRSFDGKTFDTPKECREHEEIVRRGIRNYFLNDAIIIAESNSSPASRYYIYPKSVNVDTIKLFFMLQDKNNSSSYACCNFHRIVERCWNVIQFDDEVKEYCWLGCFDQTLRSIVKNLDGLNKVKELVDNGDPRIRGKWYYLIEASKIDRIY